MFPKRTSENLKVLNNKGQALIEYMLLIVVIVIIVQTLVSVFLKPVGTYIDSITGTYLECLLLTGELPGKASNCPFPTFESAMAEAREREEKKNGSKGAKDGAGKTANDSAAEGSDRDDGSEGGQAGSRATFAGSASRRSGFGRSGGGAGDGPAATQEKSTVVMSTGGSDYAGTGGGGRASRGPRIVMITGQGNFDDNVRKKSSAGGPRPPTTLKAAANESAGGGPKTTPFKTPPISKKVSETEMSTSLGIGGIIRTLLIVAIIVIVVILIGGQVMQIFKGMEKGE